MAVLNTDNISVAAAKRGDNEASLSKKLNLLLINDGIID